MNLLPMGRANLALAALSASLLTACACAQPTGAHDRPGPPPPEALAACKSSAAGQTCSFTTARGTASGTCWAPEGKPLACKPKDAPAPAASAPKS